MRKTNLKRLATWGLVGLGAAIAVLTQMQFAVVQSASYEAMMVFSVVAGTLFLALLLYNYWSARTSEAPKP